jgi:hypothetical protein
MVQGDSLTGRKNTMKHTMTTHEIADELKQDENANWSWAGCLALAEYMEAYERDTGEEVEFDCVAIRCEYSEYSSLQAWAEEYFGGVAKYRKELDIGDDPTDEEMDQTIRDHIEYNGTLIEFDGGVIVSSF